MYQFKQAITFPSKGEKAFHAFKYGELVKELPEEVEKHPFFLKMVEAGLVVEAEEVKEVPQESPQERSKRLAEKLSKKSEEPKGDDEEPKKDKHKKKSKE